MRLDPVLEMDLTPSFWPQVFSIEKQQCRQRLNLRRGRHPPIHRQMGQECLHLGRAHLRWMPLAMKQNEAPDPIDIRLLSSQGVVFDPQPITYLIRQTRLLHGSQNAAYIRKRIRLMSVRH